MEYSCCISDYIWSRDLTTIKSTVVIMALFDQQQQQEEQPNQIQPYGVCVGPRRIRNVQQVPYVPDMNMGRPLFRARQLPAYPVREQQQHVMLQDRINQDVQHNMIQDNIAYNRRLYDDPQVMSPNRPEEDAPMVNPLNGPQNEQRGPEVLYQQNTLIQQVVHFESDPELRHLVQGNDASIEQIIQEIIQINRTIGHMSKVLTEAFAGVRGDAQNQNKNLHDLASQMVLSQTRLQEISAEITRVSRSEMEPLKERCRKAELEIISLLRRVQEAQEGASRVPELERELKIAKERIEKLELRGVQTTEMHQHSMNQLGERLARLESQPQSISQIPASGNSAASPVREEHGKRIQELQIWVQALNGGTSALVDPRNWQNPLLGLQAEQKTQRAQWEELNQLYNTIRNQYTGLLKDLGKHQEKVDRLPIQALEAKYHQLESRIEEIQRLGTHPIHGKITSSGLHSIQSAPTQFGSTQSNPIQSDGTQSNPMASNPIDSNATKLDSNPTHGISSMPSQSNPMALDGQTVNPPPRTQVEKVEYMMKHLECLDRHITQYEQSIEDQLEQHEIAIQEVSNYSQTVAHSHNQVADQVTHLFDTVDKMQKSWENWAEWTPVDQEQDEGQETQAPVQEESRPFSQQPVMEAQQQVLDHSSRTLLDVTPVLTPAQSVRDDQASIVLPIATPIRVSTPECACSRLAIPSLKGVTRIYVEDQTHFKVGKIIIICELFMAQVIAFGSLVLDRPLDRDYPAGASIREVAPTDDVVVDVRGRTIINGIAMDPSSSSSSDPNTRDHTHPRQMPPLPAEGGLNESQGESKLHTWLLQGMALRGKAHWKDCADYYERYKPVAADVFPKEDNIKHDQYTKAFSQIGQVPSTEGRLMTVVEQVVVFEQNILRTLKGLSPACEFYAKLLLHGMYQFLEQLRSLTTATEQATQTFATSQAEEMFHPQLEALLITWLSNKLPEVVRKRAHNRRPQPSARILLTEFYFTLFPQPDDQAKHLGNIARNPTSTSQNPTDVIINIETWRTSIQMLKDISGCIPMKQDIRSAFDKLVAPLAKHDEDFSLTKTLCQREAYKAITTTDDDVYNYIISIMEAIHKLPKNTKWESTKPKAQAINTSSGGVDSTSNKGKGKGKGKGKTKAPPLPNGKGKGGKGKGKGKTQSKSKASTPVPEGKGQSKGSTPAGKPAGGKPSGEPVKKKPKQCVFYASPAGCIRGKSCTFLHQNDSVTKKPLPADPADVQRMKGKLQSVPKVTPLNLPNSGTSAAATAVPVSSSGATSSVAPISVLQVSMLRVDRHQIEPEPEPIRRHPVANWRPHPGPTEEKHPRFLLTMPDPKITIHLHMAGQHFEHIVFGANQYACWLRCTQCEAVSPRIYYRFTVCMKCPGRRREDHEPLWHISTRCVLMKWNCLVLRLFWMGTEDRRAYFARQLHDLRQIRQSIEADGTELMDIFHDTVEPDPDMTQASCDLRWAPPTRHAVLNEELADIDLDSEECRPISLAQQEQSMEQPGTIRSLDNLRAEVSLEQDSTSLADRFSRGGLPIIVDQLHGGITMREDSVYADALQNDEDELDETRSNEAHPRQVRRQYDPYNAQGSSPSKPFEGLEQCLSWHQQAWNYASHACPCHRRRCMNFQFEEPTQPPAVEGYSSHRGYPILKPPHTTKQTLTRVRDRGQDHDLYHGRDPRSGPTHTERTSGVTSYSAGTDMRSGGTTSNSDRISAMPCGVMNTRHTEYDMRQRHSSGVPTTYSTSRPLLGRDGQDSEGASEKRVKPLIRGSQMDPAIRRTSDHEDSRRLAAGLPANLSGTPRAEGQGSHPGVDSSALGRQTDPGDRRTSNWRNSTCESHPMGLASTYGPSTAIERPIMGHATPGTTTSGSTQTTIASR